MTDRRFGFAGALGAALLMAAAVSLVPGIADANDSEAAVGIGGLVFERNEQVSMESEDLYLSPGMVQVRYRYRNVSPQPVTITIAFPLPESPLSGTDWDWSEAVFPDWGQIGMKTRVDGRPVALARVDVPRVAGRDVTERLRALGWPVRFWESKGFAARLARLPVPERSAYLAEGLLAVEGSGGQGVRPAWTVATSFVRRQTFPPGVPVTVEHSYVPELGGSVGAMLDPSSRREAMAGPDGYAARYCVDRAFLAAYDRKRNGADGRPDPALWPSEKWLGYLLSPGANWKGPIGRFHLTVDKGSPTSLVSLCMDGIRKTGPTRFEVVRTNFEPDRDIHVLFVDMFALEGGGN